MTDETLASLIVFLRLGRDGCVAGSGELLKVQDIDKNHLQQLRELIRIYFKFSGQKGMGINEIKAIVKHQLLPFYPYRGLIYLAFSLEGYVFQHQKGIENPNIRCRLIDLKNWNDRCEHFSRLDTYLNKYQIKLGSVPPVESE